MGWHFPLKHEKDRFSWSQTTTRIVKLKIKKKNFDYLLKKLYDTHSISHPFLTEGGNF